MSPLSNPGAATFHLPQGSQPDTAAPGHVWAMRLLIAGLFLTAIAGMPSQQVQANTIKSIVAALFCTAALIAFFLPSFGQTNGQFRGSAWLLVP